MFGKLAWKISRIRSLARLAGLPRALRFELEWTLRRPVVRIHLRGYPRPFEARRFSTDVAILMQTFVDSELKAYYPVDPRFIIDAGANVGYVSAYYARMYPRATVVAIEPSAANCERIRANCAAFDNVVLLEGAVWSTPTRLRIANPDADAWGYRVEEGGAESEVRAYTMNEIVERFGIDRIDFLKMDIEGAERNVFEADPEPWLARVDAMIIELHNEAAREAVARACPPDTFTETRLGYNSLYVRNGAKRAPVEPTRGSGADPSTRDPRSR